MLSGSGLKKASSDFVMQGIEAAFMRNHRGDVCIAFSDPAYARSESIVFDRKNHALYALVHESCHYIGKISDAMVQAFDAQKQVLLTAIRPDGSVIEMMAPIDRDAA